MRTPDLIHNDLLENIADFFNVTVKVQNQTGTSRDDFNAPVESWTDYETEVKAVVTVQRRERNDGSQDYVNYNYVFLLKGYYSGITNEMRVVYDGNNYNIINVHADSRTLLTKLVTEKITA